MHSQHRPVTVTCLVPLTHNIVSSLYPTTTVVMCADCCLPQCELDSVPLGMACRHNEWTSVKQTGWNTLSLTDSSCERVTLRSLSKQTVVNGLTRGDEWWVVVWLIVWVCEWVCDWVSDWLSSMCCVVCSVVVNSRVYLHDDGEMECWNWWVSFV